MNTVRRLSLFGAVVLMVAACGSSDLDLSGDWTLESGTLAGSEIPLVAGAPITLSIEGDLASGTSACNQYSTVTTLDGSTVTFGAIAGTQMACDDEVMASERAYLDALAAVDRGERDGDGLVLSGPGTELVFSIAP
jgi:heat shock protein HslJ